MIPNMNIEEADSRPVPAQNLSSDTTKRLIICFVL